jgi:hypothetical protein
LIAEINQINNCLVNLSEKSPNYDKIAYRLLGESPVESDMDRLVLTKGRKLQLEASATSYCQLAKLQANDKIEFLKFCVWHLGEGKGILIPGDTSMGACAFSKELYVFNIPEPAAFFNENPKRYLYKIVETARRKIQLISFLDMFDRMQLSYNCHLVDTFKVPAPLTCEQEVQTELHPPDNIDPHYRWNVWDLRREAIKLADLRNKRTTSVQTVDSRFRKTNSTQIYERKKNSAQTKDDGYLVATETEKHLAVHRSGIKLTKNLKQLELSVSGVKMGTK